MLECFECGEVNEGSVDDSGQCDNCESYSTREVVLTACDVGDDCEADTHDFGLGVHIDPVDE